MIWRGDSGFEDTDDDLPVGGGKALVLEIPGKPPPLLRPGGLHWIERTRSRANGKRGAPFFPSG